ncbi:hypothetical protein BASA81_008572 [Batrachochytrium salamandrivorans]|nr:hypothetical protein BASA81_008572 [Batrachochytrium salamandrivorans]
MTVDGNAGLFSVASPALGVNFALNYMGTGFTSLGGVASTLFVGNNGNIFRSNMCLPRHPGITGSCLMIQFLGNSANEIGSITCTPTATSYNTSSDYRLKKNIVPMTDGLEKVLQLGPVYYNWKVDSDSVPKTPGFVAHEVQSIVPDAVSGDKDAILEDGNIRVQVTYGDEFDIRSDNSIRFKLRPDEVGFIDYMLINQFLSQCQVQNLVIIDSDLILESGFRIKMENALKSNDVVHGFDKNYELIDDQVSNVLVQSYYINGVGHCGYVYGFSARFLESIGNQFPDYFLIGGFDWVLANIITGKNMVPFSKFMFYDRLLEFADRVKGLKYTYLDHTVLHCYHGPRYKRLTPFKVYEHGVFSDWFRLRNG